MATPLRTPARRRTAGRVGLSLAGAVGILLATVPASANPGSPGTSGEAARLLAERGHQLEVVTEQFNEARDTLTAQQAAAEAAAAQLQQATADLARAQEQVRGIARSAWTGEGLGSFQALLTSESADEFVSRVSILETISGHQGVVLAQAAEAGVAAAQAQATAQEAAAQARATYDSIAVQQAELQEQVDEFRAQFDRLSTAERQAVAEAHHAEERGGEPQRASRDEREAPAPAAPVVADSAAAQKAVDAAMAQRGKPYVWAATGPSAFDCSGLTSYAYRAAGISLPRASRNQAGVGRAVSRAELRPGDLVFFYSPISHVGIYIGNGQMVHAPTSGDVVKVASIDSMGGYAGARRVAG
ncbi:NlpC/P60 family protein [Blastococcus sp. MG754426]|uniref:C40 family peptidase n=1 Tax=unclassified Blastococcus TaxID=2619396 RepID=UPI001EF08568|nr:MULTISPECIES: C40 family peptidase [unclassified Blastococcus]MCF6509822.1 NlpC/P60 family protein [Blastococcus sp. MG754426]MCF6514445.1 NlpC/P60 family protein [Blastococcus sp. MG754427]MCF6737473.1 NlpC/P60 family protein [Blastococcus sp. KM273129]